MKQSQISLILMIVALLLLLVVLLPYLRIALPVGTASDPTDVALYVEHNSAAAMAHCLNQIGLHGGRIDPASSLKTPFGNIDHAYQSEPAFLAEQEMKRELEQCVRDTLLVCIDDFREAQALGIAVTFDQPKVVAQLATLDTSVSIDFPISMEAGETRQTFDRFTAEQPVRLRTLHQIIEQVAHDRASYVSTSDIDLSYLGGLGVDTNIYEYGDSQIYEMRDNGSRLDNGPFVFLSAHSFEE